MANPSSSCAADAELDSAGPPDTAARQHQLVAWLTRRRAASGLSQADVARLMRTSQSSVARFESGEHDVRLSTLLRYTEVLRLSLDFVEDIAARSRRPARARAGARATGRPGREPGQSDMATTGELAEGPDPEHVLTWRQHKVLEVLMDSAQRGARSPSLREIGEAVGLTSTSSVAFQLTTLESKG